MTEDNLTKLESRLQDIVRAQSQDHLDHIPPYPLTIPEILLELTQEVIKLRQETAGERRNWGRMHT